MAGVPHFYVHQELWQTLSEILDQLINYKIIIYYVTTRTAQSNSNIVIGITKMTTSISSEAL